MVLYVSLTNCISVGQREGEAEAGDCQRLLTAPTDYRLYDL